MLMVSRWLYILYHLHDVRRLNAGKNFSYVRMPAYVHVYVHTRYVRAFEFKTPNAFTNFSAQLRLLGIFITRHAMRNMRVLA